MNNNFRNTNEYKMQVEKAKQQLFIPEVDELLKTNEDEEKVIAKFFHCFAPIDYYVINYLGKNDLAGGMKCFCVFAHNRKDPDFSEIGIMYEQQLFPIWERRTPEETKVEPFVLPYERDITFKPISLPDLKKELKL